MVARRGFRTRARRRQAVQQTMEPTPVSSSTRHSAKSGSSSARSKRMRAQRKCQPLLALLPQLILASMNIDGLTPETEWAVDSMLAGNQYDVSVNSPLFFPVSGF